MRASNATRSPRKLRSSKPLDRFNARPDDEKRAIIAGHEFRRSEAEYDANERRRSELRKTPEAKAARHLAAFWAHHAKALEDPDTYAAERELYKRQAFQAFAVPFRDAGVSERRDELLREIRKAAITYSAHASPSKELRPVNAAQLPAVATRVAARAIAQFGLSFPEDASKIDASQIEYVIVVWNVETKGRRKRRPDGSEPAGKWGALAAATVTTSFATDADGWNSCHKALRRRRPKR